MDTTESIDIIKNFMRNASYSVCDDYLYSALQKAVEIMESHSEGEYATRRGRHSSKNNSLWVPYNANPKGKRVGDCAIRACCKATDRTWNQVFDYLAGIAYDQKDVLSANTVWGQYLNENGYERHKLEHSGNRYDVIDFCMNHPQGEYALGLDGHVLTAVDGMYYDTWDSGEKEVLYYWERED